MSVDLVQWDSNDFLSRVAWTDRKFRPMGGEQWVMRFDNGYGFSAIQGPGAYQGTDTYEVAVVKWNGTGDNDWEIVYDTPFTNDVLSHQTPDDVKGLAIRLAFYEHKEEPNGPTPGFLAIGECNENTDDGWSYEMVEASTFDEASAALLDDLMYSCVNDYSVGVLKLWFEQYYQGVTSIDVIVPERLHPHIRYRFAWSPAK